MACAGCPVVHTPGSKTGQPTREHRQPSRTGAVQSVTTACLIFRHDWRMGDKSLKAKQRDQKQKDAAKVGTAAVAKAKQERGMRVPQPVSKAAGRA